METLVIQAKGKKLDALVSCLRALNISFKSKSEYSEAFVKKIEHARKNYQKGEYITIKDTKNIWESILSE